MPYFPETAGTSFWGYEGGAGSLSYVLDYVPIILLGAPFSMAAIALSSMARACGSPILAMGCVPGRSGNQLGFGSNLYFCF